MGLYLAIDLGTTGCRSILYDGNLTSICAEYEEYELITPQAHFVEQNAEKWWEMTLRTAKKAIEKSGVDGKEIASVSISSQGITIVPVDEDVKPLCNALSWLDTRAEAETAQIDKDFTADQIYSLTGKALISAYSLPKILWLKEHQPEIYNGAYKFLMPMDYLLAKFTGIFATDYSMASGTLMFDLKRFCWSDKILDFYGISKEKLPALMAAGEKVGFVLPSVAETLGLKDDCIVAMGAQDQKCAAYGAGLTDGVMTISLGTAAAITKLWRQAHTEKNCGVGWCGYADDQSFVTEGVIATAGTSLRWIRDTYFKNESYKILDAEAKDAMEKGSELLFYPFMAGPSSPFYYPESTGVFYGINLGTCRGDFALAVMEGIAFQIREILEIMEAYGNVHTVVLFGGGAKSKLWAQIIADATGMNIYTTNDPEAAGAGAAMLAAKAVGKQLKPLALSKPYIPENAEKYNKKYHKYIRFEKNLWA